MLGPLSVAIGLDASLFAVAMLAFLVLREERGDARKSAPLLGEPVMEKSADEASLSHLWSVSIGALRNSDARAYLRFLQVQAIFFAILAVLGCGILPIYTSGGRYTSGLERWSIENLPPGSTHVWAAAAFTACVALLGYMAVGAFYTQLDAGIPSEDVAILVRNIDPSVVDTRVLRGYFERRFPGAVQQAIIARDYREMEAAQARLDTARNRLARGWWGAEKVREEVVYYEKMLGRLVKRGPTRGTGVGFVVFQHADCVEQAVRKQCAYGWVAERAPLPTDVEWKNLPYVGSSWGRWFVGACWSVALCVFLVVVISPVAVLYKLEPLVQDVTSQLHGPLRAMVAAYMPPLVVFMVNSLLTPVCISLAASRMRHWRKSSRQHTVLSMNAFFLVLNTFLVPLMSLQSIPHFLGSFLRLPVDEWNTALGGMFLSSSGSFSIQYMVSSVFLSNGAQLLQIPRFVFPSMADQPFDFGFWYASALSVVTLCLGFSVVVPLVLPWAAVYFTVKLYVDKYNFLFEVCQPGLDSGRMARAAIPYWCVSLALFEFCMSGFFAVQGGELALVGLGLCAASVVTVVGAICFPGPNRNKSLDKETTYRHPLDV